jgi:hypothetical protein
MLGSTAEGLGSRKRVEEAGGRRGGEEVVRNRRERVDIEQES